MIEHKFHFDTDLLVPNFTFSWTLVEWLLHLHNTPHWVMQEREGWLWEEMQVCGSTTYQMTLCDKPYGTITRVKSPPPIWKDDWRAHNKLAKEVENYLEELLKNVNQTMDSTDGGDRREESVSLRFKQLEWSNYLNTYRANSVVGVYSIYMIGGTQWRWRADFSSAGAQDADSAEDGKAKCQADFEARMMAGLEEA